jgi:hypothetical protein
MPRAQAGKGGVVPKLVHLSLAPVARRQAAASAVVRPSCATARPREWLLRRSRAAASGQEAKVKVREVSPPRASAGQPSAPLRLCRRNVLQRRSVVRLQALRRRDRALLLRRGRDRNRRQPPVQHREEVARHREAAAGAKNSGNRRIHAIEALTPVLHGGRRHCGAEAASGRAE